MLLGEFRSPRCQARSADRCCVTAACNVTLSLQGLHDTVLPGKLLLQVDEVANIGVAIRERYTGKDNGSRCLKLLLTDGGCCAL